MLQRLEMAILQPPLEVLPLQQAEMFLSHALNQVPVRAVLLLKEVQSG